MSDQNTNEIKYVAPNPSYQINNNTITTKQYRSKSFSSSQKRSSTNKSNHVYYESLYLKKCPIVKSTYIINEKIPQKKYQHNYSSNLAPYERLQCNEEYIIGNQLNRRNRSVSNGYILENTRYDDKKDLKYNSNNDIILCNCCEIPKNFQDNSLPEQFEKKNDNLIENKFKFNMNIPQSITQFSQIQNSNVELSQKTEEKTIILLPGQTVEMKNISETIDDPIEEVIQYTNGKTSIIIKQTKITKVVENFPIEVVEKNNPNGQKLPAIKQIITYYYKTVINNKDTVFKKGNENLIINNTNDNNDNANNNVNNYLNNEDNNNKELVGNNNEFLNDEYMNKFFDETKGDNATLEERNKRMEYFKYLYRHICNCENNEEKYENLDKISSRLISLDEKEKNIILNVLCNLEPKNEKLYTKLTELIKSEGNNEENNININKKNNGETNKNNNLNDESNDNKCDNNNENNDNKCNNSNENYDNTCNNNNNNKNDDNKNNNNNENNDNKNNNNNENNDNKNNNNTENNDSKNNNNNENKFNKCNNNNENDDNKCNNNNENNDNNKVKKQEKTVLNDETESSMKKKNSKNNLKKTNSKKKYDINFSYRYGNTRKVQNNKNELMRKKENLSKKVNTTFTYHSDAYKKINGKIGNLSQRTLKTEQNMNSEIQKKENENNNIIKIERNHKQKTKSGLEKNSKKLETKELVKKNTSGIPKYDKKKNTKNPFGPSS